MPDLFPDALERIFAQNLPAFAQFFLQNGSRRRNPVEQISTDIVRQVVSHGGLAGTPASSQSFGASRGSFRASRGQSMAQLAAALTRASRRYL